MKYIDIAFDLDGTLIWLMPIVEKILWEQYKVKIPENRKFHTIITEPEISLDELWVCFCEAFAYIDEIEIYPGATELLRKLWMLSNENDPVRIITARPHSTATNTYKIVEKVCPDFPYELIIVEDSEDKKLHLNHYNYFVDDRRKTAKDLVHHGKIVYLPKRNYNQPIAVGCAAEALLINVIDDIQELIPIAHKFIKENL